MSGVTLYRAVDALGGTAMSSSAYDQAFHDGHSQALDAVLAILTERGFSEEADAAPSWDDPLTIAEEAMIDRAYQRHVAADNGCEIPPAGWSCIRAKGHYGPCATTPQVKATGK